MNNIDLDLLLNTTIFIIPNTSHIFLDYKILKTYATPDVYEKIITYIIKLLNECIEKYDMFEMHISLNSFTMSALERHFNIIRIFCEKCLLSGVVYGQKMTKLHIYYIPNVFDKIASILDKFINADVKKKIIKYTKEESEIVSTKLYELCNKIE